MAVSESARNDLYNGLRELLGADRAETLMTYLPAFDPSTVATRGDILDFKNEVDERFVAVDRRFAAIDRRFAAIDRRFDTVERRFDDLGKRIDRVLLTLAAGLFVIVAAFIGLVGVVLNAP